MLHSTFATTARARADIPQKNIDIVPKEGGSGLDIYVKPFTKNENVHIPALITQGWCV